MTELLPIPEGVPHEACLRAAIDSLASCSAITDADGRILAANAAWMAYSGENPFIKGLGVGSNFKDACVAAAAAADGNISIVGMGVLEILKGKIQRLSLEFPVHHAPQMQWYGLMANLAAPGLGLGIVVHILDITEKMLAKQRLHRTEQLFKVSTENALNLFCILDPKSRIQYASPSYNRSLGIMPSGWADQRYDSRIHEDDQAPFAEHMNSCLKNGLSPLFEYRLLAKENTWTYLEGQASMVEGISGDVMSLLLISKDITTRKAAESERAVMEIQLRHSQKMEAIGQLAAGIAHEINTPTQYLSDNLHFLQDGFRDLCEGYDKAAHILQNQPDAAAFRAWAEERDIGFLLEEIPKALHQSEDGIKRVASIVQAMKSFSHPGSEGNSAVDLNHALETTLLVAKNEWKYIARVETEFDPSLPLVNCHPGEMNQVFLNLVVNAAHAIAEVVGASGRQGLIRIQTLRTEHHIEIRISDTGTGIPEKVRDQVFLPFFTTKAVGKGTGQGLSIVHSVVAKHNGTVTFETEEGKGTTFIVKLPLPQPDSPV